MAKRVLMKGNEAVAEAAIRAGCRYFFGYPITPQNEIPEYLSRELPRYGGKFVQAESELAAINMLFGGAATGKRCLTSSSSCGISLKAEGMSYIAAAELPCVIVDMSRMGPGIGDLTPTQSSYRQATRGAGHGGYRSIVFCPGSVQEAFDMMFDAFELAEKHSIISYIYADGLIGQVMEPVELRDPIDPESLPTPDWALTGIHDRGHANHAHSGTNGEIFERLNKVKYPAIEAAIQRWKDSNLEDCEYVVTGFGTVGRIAEVAVKRVAEATGKKIGFIRPLIAWPFPKKAFDKIPDTCKKVVVIEANNGQMLEDVELTLKGKFDVAFEPTWGSNMPTVEQVVEMLERQL
jgi:2-oxoglutarate/2-oxoacid ferredoxin oxidoreductase subunit alpha